MSLEIYYEGGTRDRFWLAPEGLTMTEALAQRESNWYRTREGARRELVNRLDAEKRATGSREA